MADDTRRIRPKSTDEVQPPEAFTQLVEKSVVSDQTIPLELPDGRLVVLAKPKGSNIARMIRITSELVREMKIGDEAQLVAMESLKPYVDAVFHVKSLDGKHIVPVMTGDQYQALADNITDDGLMSIIVAISKHWGVNKQDDELVKK